MDTPSPAPSDPEGTLVTFSVSGLPASSLTSGDTLTYEYGGAVGNADLPDDDRHLGMPPTEDCNESELGVGTYSDIVAVFSGDDNLARGDLQQLDEPHGHRRVDGLRWLLAELHRGHALAGGL